MEAARNNTAMILVFSRGGHERAAPLRWDLTAPIAARASMRATPSHVRGFRAATRPPVLMYSYVTMQCPGRTGHSRQIRPTRSAGVLPYIPPHIAVRGRPFSKISTLAEFTQGVDPRQKVFRPMDFLLWDFGELFPVCIRDRAFARWPFRPPGRDVPRRS